jgi:predicted dehydrogenase
MFKLAEEADKKNLKVGVGLMVRHCKGRQELYQKIRGGELGELIMMRAYRLGGQAARAPKPDGNELLYQVRRFT